MQSGTSIVGSPVEPHESLGFARYLAWISLFLIISLTAILSTYIGNFARRELIIKQKEFAQLLVVNLNSNIARRFASPTLYFFGDIDLSSDLLYSKLDDLIKADIKGLNVNSLRIYDAGGSAIYSLDKSELKKHLDSSEIENSINKDSAISKVNISTPYWKSLLMFDLPANSYTLKTTYAIKIPRENPILKASGVTPYTHPLDSQKNEKQENNMQAIGTASEENLVWILEFTRDLTQDIARSGIFQQFIIVFTLFTSSFFVAILLFFIRRSERALSTRMKEEQRLVLELHQSEKLAGMGRVIASIAHEIRNPLGIIRSSAELLLKRSNGEDKVNSRILQAIYDEAKRLSQTVSDFLDYARPKQLKSECVDILLLIHQAQTFLEPELYARNICVAMEGETSATVSGDSALLYRVFYNILVNAIQATENQGNITIRISMKNSMKGIIGKFIEISFIDSGPGFAKDNINKVLDPFFTTKDEGTGLGLAIVSSIIQSHRGVLELTNAKEGGACVTVVLPQ